MKVCKIYLLCLVEVKEWNMEQLTASQDDIIDISIVIQWAVLFLNKYVKVHIYLFLHIFQFL